MTIYEALETDHRKVKQLLIRLVGITDKNASERHDLISQIRDELIPHARAEESIFYNSMRELESGNEEVMHGYKEHMEAETLLRMLQVRDKIDMEWKKTAQQLKDALEHHIQEEESKIFSVARRLFTEEEARMMGQAFEKLKMEVKDEGFMKTTVDLVTNLMPPRLTSLFKSKGSKSQSIGRTA
ncbi:MAG: hemerythrin domain-containing protein [Bdellovibrionales bacterium]